MASFYLPITGNMHSGGTVGEITEAFECILSEFHDFEHSVWEKREALLATAKPKNCWPIFLKNVKSFCKKIRNNSRYFDTRDVEIDFTDLKNHLEKFPEQQTRLVVDTMLRIIMDLEEVQGQVFVLD